MVFARLNPPDPVRRQAGRSAVALCRALAIAITLCAGGSLAFCAGEAKPTTPIDLQPYRVAIELSFSIRPDLDSAFRSQVIDQVRQGLDRSLGNLWEFTIQADRGHRPAGRDALERVRQAEVQVRYGTEGLDKLFLLSVEVQGGGFRVCGREWDSITSQLGPIHQADFFDRREVSRNLLSLLQGLFRPVAAISQARNGPLLLHPKGGGLAPHDEHWLPVTEGALFEAYYRYLNKEQVVERVQQVPWTYLTAGTMEAGACPVTVTSGLRGAISARRRRIEVVALMVRQRSASTRLTLVTFPPRRRPLGGIEVEIMSAARKEGHSSAETRSAGDKAAGEMAAQEHDSVPTVRLVTDRNGRVDVSSPEEADGKPVWLMVRSGQNLLAKVPFVPGIRAEEVLELPDDTLRLEVEGEVAQLQSELVDTVARRAVLSALARNRAKARDWEGADDYLKQVAAVPKSTTFLASLNAIRINGLDASRAQKDRMTELRVKRLCDETAELIKNYLEDEKLNELREEIAELKQIAQEDEAAEKQFGAEKKPPSATGKKTAVKPAAGKPEVDTLPSEAAAAGSTTETSTDAPSEKEATSETKDSKNGAMPGTDAKPGGEPRPKPKGPAF